MRYRCFLFFNLTISDCGVVKNIQNGKITLDDASSSTMGATATVECDPGYKASREIIKCLKTGKWRKSSCKIKGTFQMITYILIKII
jgi:hypothetical protein